MTGTRQTRRSFLKLSAATTLGFVGLGCACDATLRGRSPGPYGDLVMDPEGIIDLPRGFSYDVVARAGDRMTDGLFMPGKQDGMAAFAGSDGTILICNHENDVGQEALSAFGVRGELNDRVNRELVYDVSDNGLCPGATTTILYDTNQRRTLSMHLSLAGTLRNCAGGLTPWNSWITCEETVRKAGESCQRDHGYAFEIPATTSGGLTPPVPLVEMGRFCREAVAVDERSGIVYQTEDRGDGLLYRYIPRVAQKLGAGGRLQALAVIDQPSLDTGNALGQTVPVGEPLAVRWIDLEDIGAPDDDLRHRGFAMGAAHFVRGEGMWYGEGVIYFACTSGGRIGKGQIWKYTPSPHEGTEVEEKQPGMLELFIEPNDECLVDNADNLVVSPWGDLLLAEDGLGEQYLVGVTPDGTIYKFGRNAFSQSEFAGLTFAPDGSALFVNIQHSGLTLAIFGPWAQAAGRVG
jgi:hypothetical protein